MSDRIKGLPEVWGAETYSAEDGVELLEEVEATGLLALANHLVFHPIGLQLAATVDESGRTQGMVLVATGVLPAARGVGLEFGDDQVDNMIRRLRRLDGLYGRIG